MNWGCHWLCQCCIIHWNDMRRRMPTTRDPTTRSGRSTRAARFENRRARSASSSAARDAAAPARSTHRDPRPPSERRSASRPGQDPTGTQARRAIRLRRAVGSRTSPEWGCENNTRSRGTIPHARAALRRSTISPAARTSCRPDTHPSGQSFSHSPHPACSRNAPAQPSRDRQRHMPPAAMRDRVVKRD